MQLPKKINPCPIAEAICEIRFESNIPDDAIFGVIYNCFKEEFEDYIKLPILQLPEQIRSNDQNLIYKPHYKLLKNDFQLQVGPKVFSCINIGPYIGWDKFSDYLYRVFDKIEELNIIQLIKRIGLRYINVFPKLDIYQKSNFKITLDESNIDSIKNIVYVEIKDENCILNLRVLNNSEIDINEEKILGSLIDIDTILINYPEKSLKQLKPLIDKAHVCEKKLFFKLLSEDFLNSLQPEY